MLDGIRVLDLSDERGQMCGMMLADLGADVVCVPRPSPRDRHRVEQFSEDDPSFVAR